MVSGTEQKNSTSLFLPWISYQTIKPALAPETDYNQTAMDLPPVTSAVFHHHHHHQPINVPTAGAQALIMVYI
jgi:hypothetical protein